jgi:hypothetical protein
MWVWLASLGAVAPHGMREVEECSKTLVLLRQGGAHGVLGVRGGNGLVLFRRTTRRLAAPKLANAVGKAPRVLVGSGDSSRMRPVISSRAL